jgi:hypothetical protein
MKVNPVIRPGKLDRRSLAIGSDATHDESGTTEVTSEAAATTKDPTAPRTNADGTRTRPTLTPPSDSPMNNSLRPKNLRP